MAEIDGATRLYLLLGNPVDHSLSPALHNRGFTELGLNCRYLTSPVEPGRIGAAVEGLRALAVAGANVTAPFKQAVIPFLDHLSADAGLVESVNTIVNRDGLLEGYSTDGAGFIQSLRETFPTVNPSQPLLLAGAGGAARAVALAVARWGCPQIYIANRGREGALKLAGVLARQLPRVRCEVLELEPGALLEPLSRCGVIAYALPVDHEAFLTALEYRGEVPNGQVLVDFRYSKTSSKVMLRYKQGGGAISDGRGMLFWQAVEAFRLFTGREAPVEAMRGAFTT